MIFGIVKCLVLKFSIKWIIEKRFGGKGVIESEEEGRGRVIVKDGRF